VPYSSESGKGFIEELFTQLKPYSVLDVGAGSGTYARRLQHLCTPSAWWAAVEIWEPYVEKYGLRELYHTVEVADARTWQPERKYNVCILGDVLEHMEKEEAIAVFERMRKHADHVVISIPLGHYPQDEYEGNPYERHVTDNWSHEDVVDAFGEPNAYQIENEIGVYVYKRLKIAVYAISKNEEQFVARFCSSAADADLVVIGDTGSSDNTVELAETCGAAVYNICISPWRFDRARDAVLAMVPADYDVCISLDLDEVMEPGWRPKIEKAWKPGTTRLRYQFDWGCGIRFYYEKIHHRHGYHWHHPVHEYPVADKRIIESYAQVDDLLVSHHPDPNKSRGQYLSLLRMSVQEDPSCPRNAFYFARELTFYEHWQEAIQALTNYLAMPQANWPNERCYAMRLLGKSYDAIGNSHIAMQWYRRACAETPGSREPWVDLAMACYQRMEWLESFTSAMKALEIKDKALVYTCDPEVWGAKAHDLAAIAAHHLGFKDIAKEQGRLAAELSPDDLRLKDNLQYYAQAA
jgi:hypothetical protein